MNLCFEQKFNFSSSQRSGNLCSLLYSHWGNCKCKVHANEKCMQMSSSLGGQAASPSREVPLAGWAMMMWGHLAQMEGRARILLAHRPI